MDVYLAGSAALPGECHQAEQPEKRGLHLRGDLYLQGDERGERTHTLLIPKM